MQLGSALTLGGRLTDEVDSGLSLKDRTIVSGEVQGNICPFMMLSAEAGLLEMSSGVVMS